MKKSIGFCVDRSNFEQSTPTEEADQKTLPGRAEKQFARFKES
jgi:hypothetical protein